MELLLIIGFLYLMHGVFGHWTKTEKFPDKGYNVVSWRGGAKVIVTDKEKYNEHTFGQFREVLNNYYLQKRKNK